MINKKAFTLTELLVALGIIGAIAAMAIPSIMNSINNRMHATQVKNITQAFQQLISDQLLKNRTKDLTETDFAGADTLFTKKNFDIASSCADAAKDCWKTTADTNPVTYKSINNTDATVATSRKTILLTSGTILSYESQNTALTDGDVVIGIVDIDVNGSEMPNIWGRDFFSFWVTKKGKIVGKAIIAGEPNMTLADKITKCKAGDGGYCYDALVENGWVMPY